MSTGSTLASLRSAGADYAYQGNYLGEPRPPCAASISWALFPHV